MLVLYAQAKKLASFGETVLARKVDDAIVLARTSFHIEDDHVEPHLGGKNPSALWNHEHRCWPGHTIKTENDRKAGKLRTRPGGRPLRTRNRRQAAGGHARKTKRRALKQTLPALEC